MAETANLSSLLAHAAERHGGRDALVESGTVLDYRGMFSHALRCAGALRARGIQPGDRVAILLPNGWHYAVSYFGAQLAGSIAVLVNARLSAPEIAHVLADSGASLVITDDTFAERLPTGTISVRAAELLAGRPPSTTELPGMSRASTDVAHLLYTSGTTGRPKGAMQTHENLLFNAGTVREQFTLTPRDRTLVVAPMFHATGINSQLIGFVSGGACCVFAPAFKTAAALATLAEQRITVFAGVATMLQLMVMRPEFDSVDLSALRLFIMGGSPVPESLPALAAGKLPHTTLANVWGLTEATSIVTLVKGADYLSRPWTVGQAVPGVELGIARDDGTVGDLRDHVGELCVRGPILTAGYWNRPEATTEAYRDGWLHTGDVGSIDAEGYVRVLDRIKDMIIRGGENIYSLEVESALAAHPAVADVGVVGVPDEIFGERVRAVITLAPGASVTAEELCAFAAERLADYKVPAEIVFLPELPRNPNGKLIKRHLAEPPVPTT